MRKTKIVCTLGPASNDEKTIKEMLLSGMNVARLNFSHGTHQSHSETIARFRKVRDSIGIPAAVMLDTKGPEIRLRDFAEGRAVLETGSAFVLTFEDMLGTSQKASVTYKNLPKELSSGDKVLIDDGKVALSVEKTTDKEVFCRVISGGAVSNHKGVNVPCVHLNMEFLSEQDRKDIVFGIKNDVDYIAASFVRSRADVLALKEFIAENGGGSIKIISKIENIEGIENFEEILEESDGIMVARGDMGVEVEFERLPGLQKRFIKRCYQSGKVVITATQMLESMILSPYPTRAEITDVANAVFDGTSAVMLSGESAAGKNPVEAVRVMAKISEQAERDAFSINAYDGIKYEMDSGDTTNAICDATCITARDIKAKAIIAVTQYGNTARRMSKFRPFEPIVAATPEIKTYHQLSLVWGVYPVLAHLQKDSDSLFDHAVDCAKQISFVKDGDPVVIAAGYPLNKSGKTNILKVQIVGSKE